MITTLLASVLPLACVSRPPTADNVDVAVDERILREVEARLALEPVLSPASIRVEVRGARVQLHGSVAGSAAWRCAIRTTALAKDVRGIIDFLMIDPGPYEAHCRAPREYPVTVPSSNGPGPRRSSGWPERRSGR